MLSLISLDRCLDGFKEAILKMSAWSSFYFERMQMEYSADEITVARSLSGALLFCYDDNVELIDIGPTMVHYCICSRCYFNWLFRVLTWQLSVDVKILGKACSNLFSSAVNIAYPDLWLCLLTSRRGDALVPRFGYWYHAVQSVGSCVGRALDWGKNPLCHRATYPVLVMHNILLCMRSVWVSTFISFCPYQWWLLHRNSLGHEFFCASNVFWCAWKSHTCRYERVTDIPHIQPAYYPLPKSMHLQLLFLLTALLHTYVYFSDLYPCDPRHAHVPPSLAYQPARTRLWDYFCVRHVICTAYGHYGVTSYSVVWLIRRRSWNEVWPMHEMAWRDEYLPVLNPDSYFRADAT